MKPKAIIDGKLYSMSEKGIIDNANILIKNGKIIDVGKNINIPENFEKINASDRIIMPGMIDIHTHLGIYEEGVGIEGEDLNEKTNPIMPHLRAIDGINPEDIGFESAWKNGITSVVVSPGSRNVIGGEMVAIKTFGHVVDNMIIKAPVGLKVALGENPKKTYSQKQQIPSTRMAIASLIRESIVQARNYMHHSEDIIKNNYDINLKMESLIKVVKKEIPIRAHVHRSDDIMTIIRITDEFGINLILDHAIESYKLVEEISKRNINIVAGPFITGRLKVEKRNINLKTPGILSKNGIKVALTTDHPNFPIQHLSLCAFFAINNGMDFYEALKSLTIYPAQMAGINNRVGSIEIGKDADLIILKGKPLNPNTTVEQVMIDGVIIFSKLK